MSDHVCLRWRAGRGEGSCASGEREPSHTACETRRPRLSSTAQRGQRGRHSTMADCNAHSERYQAQRSDAVPLSPTTCSIALCSAAAAAAFAVHSVGRQRTEPHSVGIGSAQHGLRGTAITGSSAARQHRASRSSLCRCSRRARSSLSHALCTASSRSQSSRDSPTLFCAPLASNPRSALRLAPASAAASPPSLSLSAMRPLTEEETKVFFEKLAKLYDARRECSTAQNRSHSHRRSDCARGRIALTLVCSVCWLCVIAASS